MATLLLKYQEENTEIYRMKNRHPKYYCVQCDKWLDLRFKLAHEKTRLHYRKGVGITTNWNRYNCKVMKNRYDKYRQIYKCIRKLYPE